MGLFVTAAQLTITGILSGTKGRRLTAGAGWKLTWQKDLERRPLAGKFCYFKILFLLKGAEPLQAQGDWIRRREGSGE